METTSTINLSGNLQVRAIASEKTGKVSRTAERAHNALNGQSRHIGLSVVMNGKNALMVKTAKTGFESEVTTLDSLLSATTPNTGIFRDIFTMLVAEYGNIGEGKMNRASCVSILNMAILNGKSKMEQCALDAPKQLGKWSEYVDTATERKGLLTALIDYQETLRDEAMKAQKANLS